mgnify:CR=1 FL=1
MIEVFVFDYLNNGQLEESTYMEEPDEIVQDFYTIEKTGSSNDNGLEIASFAMRSVSRLPGGSLYKAASMNLFLKAELNALALEPEIAYVDIRSDYNDTDTRTKSYAYQAVVDIGYYPDLINS